MANKPLLLYSPIYSFTAESFVEKLLEVDAATNQDYWINSPGGSVFAGWSIIGPLNERTGKNNAKVFGDASSMSAYMLLFMDSVEALDVSTFTLHRADGYAETDEDKQFLAKVNIDLRAKMEQKIDQDKFKSVTGKTFDDMFNPDARIDINLDAKQAKKIGLIDKIIRLDPKNIAAYSDKFVNFLDVDMFAEGQATANVEENKAPESNIKNTDINLNSKKMNKETLKAEKPEVYAEILKEGIEAEQIRVKSWMAFKDVDMEAVNEGIKAGKNVDASIMAEMAVKQVKQLQIDATVEENTEEQTIDNTVEEVPETAEVKAEKAELEAFQKEINEAAGLNPKTKED